MHLLDVQNLKTNFYMERGVVPAVRDVSFHVDEGEVVAIVGESGSGKSVTAQSIMRLVSYPGKVVSGTIMLDGNNVLELSSKDMREQRGRVVSMIFQEPMTSLNPVYTCGNQIEEVIRLHQSVTRKEARRQAIDLLELVGIPDPEQRIKDYPDQLSGGMRQRVMIAIALACRPKLLIADEPTTALDVTIQAQILDLLRDLQKKLKMSILLITHDFGVVSEMADRVIVMYAGQIVEQGYTKQLMSAPKHPYTKGLLKAIPTLSGGGILAGDRLFTIKGTVPNLWELPKGCCFEPRCDCAMPICKEMAPKGISQGVDFVNCWLYERSEGDGFAAENK